MKNRYNLKPLGQFVWALVFWAFAVLLYQELERIERIGVSTRVPAIIAVAYSIGGKWGAVAVLIFIGVVCFWVGFRQILDSRN
jgi:biotin transporter BioY